MCSSKDHIGLHRKPQVQTLLSSNENAQEVSNRKGFARQ